MAAPLCFLDTETTGVHPERQVWEVAMVRREIGGAELKREFFVEVDLSQTDLFGLNIGRFYDRHPYGRAVSMQPPHLRAVPVVSQADAAILIAQWTHGAHVVGAVPNFDTESLDKLMRQRGNIPAWHYHLIDVENLAVGYIKGVNAAVQNATKQIGTDLDLDAPAAIGFDATPPWKSEDLGKALGVEPQTDEERHTAMGDVQWVMRMYDKIMGKPAW